MQENANITGHSIQLDNFSILNRESQGTIRTIQEAMFIRVNNPILNRNLDTATQLGLGDA